MSNVRIYKVPTALEKATRYARAAGMTLEAWQKLGEQERKILTEKIDADAKAAERQARADARDRHYATALGMTVSVWKGLSAAERKAKKEEVDTREKAEREIVRQRAANEKLKRDAKNSNHKKGKASQVSAGFPGATRYSTIVGLLESPSSRKWDLFLREGPYWNFLVRFIHKRDIFNGRRDRVEEAVMNACEKICKFMTAKRYKYPEEGKGYFRGFIKVVAFRAALELRRQIRRQEQMFVSESDEKVVSEFDEVHDAMTKSEFRHRGTLAKMTEAKGLEDEITPSSEHDLDIYDMSAGLNRKVAPVETKPAGKMHVIARLDDNPFSDDEMPANYNPADMFEYMTKVSMEDLEWLQKLQIHVLYLALGHVLTNERISPERRELLRLRYGLDMKAKDIYVLPRFASKNRNALDQMMKNATDELRKEAASWWELVSPNKNDFADETMMKFWRDLSRSHERAKIAIKLQDKANKVAGHIQ